MVTERHTTMEQSVSSVIVSSETHTHIHMAHAHKLHVFLDYNFTQTDSKTFIGSSRSPY